MRHSAWNSRTQLSLAVLFVAGLVYLYLPTFFWLGRQWLEVGPLSWVARDWSHGLLLVVFLAYLLWRRRGELFAVERPSLWSMPLILVGAGLYVTGLLTKAFYLSAYSLIPLVSGLAGIFFGAKRGYRLLALLLLFVLAVPFPAREWGLVGFLQEIVATGATFLARLLGANVQRSGLFITVGRDEYSVEPLCSGLNLIMALLTLVIPLLYLQRASLKTIGAALLWVPALGLATKILLVAIILAVTPRLGQEMALRLYHQYLGIPFFLGSLGVALAFLSGLPRRLLSRKQFNQ